MAGASADRDAPRLRGGCRSQRQGSFNDLVVGPGGVAYFDFYRETAMQGEIMCLTADLQMATAATDVVVPNGSAIPADGARLLVSETGADRITQFAIGPGGESNHRRTFADGIPGPDGLCLDAENAAWVGSFSTGRFLRIREGGVCTSTVHVPPSRWAVAPMLGGADRRTLYLISADTDRERYGMGISSGYLDQVGVDVEGAGWPSTPPASSRDRKVGGAGYVSRRQSGDRHRRRGTRDGQRHRPGLRSTGRFRRRRRHQRRAGRGVADEIADTGTNRWPSSPMCPRRTT